MYSHFGRVQNMTVIEKLRVVLPALLTDANWHSVGELRVFFPRVGWSAIREGLHEAHLEGLCYYDSAAERIRNAGGA